MNYTNRRCEEYGCIYDVLIGCVRCVFTQGHFVTRDPLILLAPREREAQPSHKINYVNEWLLSMGERTTEEFGRRTRTRFYVNPEDKSNCRLGKKTS